MKSNLLLVIGLFVLSSCTRSTPEDPEATRLFDKAFALYLKDKFAESQPIFEEAARRGSSDAECQLGIIFELGQGVETDFAKAHHWYKRSAEHGSCGGLYRYGRCLHKGIGTNVDLEEALKWYQRALAKDNKLARFGIAEVKEELKK